jgi:2-aminoadipate transaminase
MKDIELSSYGRVSSNPSPVTRMMSEFSSVFRDGIDINLGVGYVNEKTIPATDIHKALGIVIQSPDKYRQSLNYGDSAGSVNLIDSIRRFLVENRVGGLNDEVLREKEIIIGPNGATSLLESLAYILPEGIVVTTDPMYYIYTNFLERRGIRLLPVPEDAEGIRVDLLERKLAALGGDARQVSYFYVVTVNNPTSTVLSNRRRRELVQTVSHFCSSVGGKVPLVLDRAYEDLVHDPEMDPLESGLLYDTDGIVYEVGTLSKVLAPALRVGYMIGEGGPFMSALVQRTSDAGLSASLITQEISSWLLDNRIRQQLENVRAGYRVKARALRGWVEEQFGGELQDVSGGRAGFYLYLTFRDLETCEGSPFFRYLTRTTGDESVDGPENGRKPRVLYIPGEICVHPRGDLASIGRRQLRLSYGYEELDTLRRAITLMKEAVEFARTRHPVGPLC